MGKYKERIKRYEAEIETLSYWFYSRNAFKACKKGEKKLIECGYEPEWYALTDPYDYMFIICQLMAMGLGLTDR